MNKRIQLGTYCLTLTIAGVLLLRSAVAEEDAGQRLRLLVKDSLLVHQAAKKPLELDQLLKDQPRLITRDYGRYGIKQPLLHMLASGSSIETIKVAIAHGCEPLARDGMGETCLHVATLGSHHDLMRFFLGIGITNAMVRPKDGQSALDMAVSIGDFKGYSILIDSLSPEEVSQVSRSCSLLAKACRANSKDSIRIVEDLLKKGVPINCYWIDQTPLTCAVDRGAIEIVAHLLSLPEIDINPRKRDRRTPLHVAAIKYRNSRNSHDKAILHGTAKDNSRAAIERKHVVRRGEIYIILLNTGANVLAKDVFGKTPHDYLGEGGVEELKRFVKSSRGVLPRRPDKGTW